MAVQSLQVYKDDRGVYPNGISRNIPLDAHILGVKRMLVDGDDGPCVSDQPVWMVLLQLQHPVIGSVWVDETISTYQNKLKVITCCGGSGGSGSGAAASIWQSFIADGSGKMYLLSTKPANGKVRLFYNGVLRPDNPFSVSSSVPSTVTLDFTPAAGDTVAFNFDPETQSNPGSGGNQPADLDAPGLLALMANTGTVVFTQEGNRVRADLNSILDAPGGLVTQNGLTNGYYSKSYMDTQISYLLNLINAGGNPTIEGLPNLVEWFKIDAGLSLVGGAVDSWTGVKGTILNAPSALERPPYSVSGGAGGNAHISFANSERLIGAISIPTTQDICIYCICKTTDISPVVTQIIIQLVCNRQGDFMIQAKNNEYKVSSQGDVYYSEANRTADNNWSLVAAKSYRSETTDEAKIAVNGLSGITTLNSDNGDFFGTGTLNVGRYSDDANPFPFTGEISDIIILSTKALTGDETLINDTLNDKFDL